MKFCTKCGKEIMDEAVICPGCGCSVNPNVNVKQAVQTGEKTTLAKCAVVFSFLIPIVGLILGIVGVCKYQDERLKKNCIFAIIISIVVWIISFFVLFGRYFY